MAKLVISTFDTRARAEEAVRGLREKGFNQEISIMAKDEVVRGCGRGRRQERQDMELGGDSITDGATTGGTLGALAGLAVGLAPGDSRIRTTVCGGPIAGLLGGAASGGIAGSLIDWGIPEQKADKLSRTFARQNYGSRPIRSGENRRGCFRLRKFGANSVNTH